MVPESKSKSEYQKDKSIERGERKRKRIERTEREKWMKCVTLFFPSHCELQLKKIQRKQQQLQSQQSTQSGGVGGDTNGQSSDKSNGDKLSPFSRLGRVSSGHLSDSSADSTTGYTMSHMQYLTHSPDGQSLSFSLVSPFFCCFSFLSVRIDRLTLDLLPSM